jgi:hypothetical protein
MEPTMAQIVVVALVKLFGSMFLCSLRGGPIRLASQETASPAGALKLSQTSSRRWAAHARATPGAAISGDRSRNPAGDSDHRDFGHDHNRADPRLCPEGPVGRASHHRGDGRSCRGRRLCCS